LFEDVPVPSGRIIVRFAYYPPHESLAVGAAALAVLLILVSLGLTHLRRRRLQAMASAATPPLTKETDFDHASAATYPRRSTPSEIQVDRM
jgi:hypothetical protein